MPHMDSHILGGVRKLPHLKETENADAQDAKIPKKWEEVKYSEVLRGATISTTQWCYHLYNRTLYWARMIHIWQLSCAQGVFMGTFGMPKYCRRGYQWQEYIFRALQEEAEVRVWALSEIGQLNTTDTHLEYEDTLACLIILSCFDPCQRSRQLAQIAQIVDSCSLFYITLILN